MIHVESEDSANIYWPTFKLSFDHFLLVVLTALALIYAKFFAFCMACAILISYVASEYF